MNGFSARPPVLVTGGAGYIGSHAVLALRDAGYCPVVLDNLSTGARTAVPEDVPLVVGDVADDALVGRTLDEYAVQSVLHFAGSIRVDESVADPLKYYRNNTAASRNLIEACVRAGVRRFVFSSTAATYGIPARSPVAESDPTNPINPYGWSKLMTEQMLRDAAAVSSMSVAALRYFNVAGADPEGRAGQRGKNATHLIKVASEVATGKRAGMEIFGTDYPTCDGTCVRDYIHVSDLADAHLRMLEAMGAEAFVIYNCGYGRGYTVRDVLKAVEAACGQKLNAMESARRPGDPPELISDCRRIRREIGWQPRYDDLNLIVRSAFEWEQRLGLA